MRQDKNQFIKFCLLWAVFGGVSQIVFHSRGICAVTASPCVTLEQGCKWGAESLGGSTWPWMETGGGEGQGWGVLGPWGAGLQRAVAARGRGRGVWGRGVWGHGRLGPQGASGGWRGPVPVVGGSRAGPRPSLLIPCPPAPAEPLGRGPHPPPSNAPGVLPHLPPSLGCLGPGTNGLSPPKAATESKAALLPLFTSGRPQWLLVLLI